MLEISDALTTKPSDQSIQNRRRSNLLPRNFQDQHWINVPIPISNLEMSKKWKRLLNNEVNYGIIGVYLQACCGRGWRREPISACLFLGATAIRKHLGSKKIKSWLYLNRSNVLYCVEPQSLPLSKTDQDRRETGVKSRWVKWTNRPSTSETYLILFSRA